MRNINVTIPSRDGDGFDVWSPASSLISKEASLTRHWPAAAPCTLATDVAVVLSTDRCGTKLSMGCRRGNPDMAACGACGHGWVQKSGSVVT